MKFDNGFFIGLGSAVLSAGIVYMLNNIGMPKELITGVVAAITWLAVWLGGKVT